MDPGGWRRPLLQLGRWPHLPWLLVVVQLLVVYAVLERQHGFEHRRAPDSASYLQAAAAPSFAAAVSHYRTYGYPLFLRLAAAGGERLERVPTIQYVCYGIAVLAFWLGLRLYTGDGWLAWAGAVPLPHAFVVDLMQDIMTDALAAALTLLVAALMLAVAAGLGGASAADAGSGPLRRRRRLRRALLLGALAAAVFATYQVRPATVFLIAWVPLTALLLRSARERRLLPAGWGGWLAGIALATLLPYLAFAGARRLAVGHFGLVAFGGTNLAGVAACFLDEELVAELPPEQRPLAGAMLRARQRSGWAPLTPADDVRDWFPQYSDNIWLVAIGAAEARMRVEARQRQARGEPATVDPRPKRIRRNEMLASLSRAIIAARPRLYLKWVAGSFGYGLRQLGGQWWVTVPPALALLSWLLRRAIGAGRARASAPLLGVTALGVGYFLLYLALLAAVSWPFPRYFAATILFLPPVGCMLTLLPWRATTGLGSGAGR